MVRSKLFLVTCIVELLPRKKKHFQYATMIDLCSTDIIIKLPIISILDIPLKNVLDLRTFDFFKKLGIYLILGLDIILFVIITLYEILVVGTKV